MKSLICLLLSVSLIQAQSLKETFGVEPQELYYNTENITSYQDFFDKVFKNNMFYQSNDLNSWFAELKSIYPFIVNKFENIGNSAQNKSIKYMIITFDIPDFPGSIYYDIMKKGTIDTDLLTDNSQKPAILFVNQHIGNSILSVTHIFNLVNRIVYDILRNNDPTLLNFLKLYKLVIVPQMNPDTYDHLYTLYNAQSQSSSQDYSFIQNYVKNRQIVVNATEKNCNFDQQNGITLRGNYINNFFKGPNIIGKCTPAFRGYNPNTASEIKAFTQWMQSINISVGNKGIQQAIFIESLADSTVSQYQSLVMKPFSYDENKQLGPVLKFLQLKSDWDQVYNITVNYGNHQTLFKQNNFGDPADFFQENLFIDSYTYFIVKQDLEYVPTMNYQFQKGLVEVSESQYDLSYKQLINLARRQGPLITVVEQVFQQCSFKPNMDAYGFCSGQLITNDGAGQPIEYEDYTDFWQLAVNLYNSGLMNFNNLTQDIKVTVSLKKTKGNGELTMTKLINATFNQQSVIGKDVNGWEIPYYRHQSGFYFFTISKEVFSQILTRQTAMTLLFIMKDTTYAADDVIQVDLGFYITFPQFSEPKLFFTSSHEFSGYVRNYQGSQLMVSQISLNFAFAGWFAILLFVMLWNVLYNLVADTNKEEKQEFIASQKQLQLQTTLQNTQRGLLDQETVRGEDQAQQDQSQDSQKLQRSDSDQDIIEFVKKHNEHSSIIRQSIAGLGAETELGDNQSDIGPLVSSLAGLGKLNGSVNEKLQQSGEKLQEQEFLQWQKEQIQMLKRSRKELTKKKQQNPLAKQRVNDYNQDQIDQDGIVKQVQEELSRISEQGENSVDVSMALQSKVTGLLQKRGSKPDIQDKDQSQEFKREELIQKVQKIRRKPSEEILTVQANVDILNRSFKGSPSQPLIANRRQQPIRRTKSLVLNLDEYIEEQNMNQRRAMELEEKEKMRDQRDNLKYFINTGLFGGQKIPSVPDFQQQEKPSPKKKDQSYECIEVSSVFTEDEQPIDDLESVNTQNQHGEFNLLMHYARKKSEVPEDQQ